MKSNAPKGPISNPCSEAQSRALTDGISIRLYSRVHLKGISCRCWRWFCFFILAIWLQLCHALPNSGPNQHVTERLPESVQHRDDTITVSNKDGGASTAHVLALRVKFYWKMKQRVDAWKKKEKPVWVEIV